MSEHFASVCWELEGSDFSYTNYSRDHVWEIGSTRIEASAASEFLGSAERCDPEQAFIASLASCHMLTFLAIASKQRIKVLAYVDKAVGWLEPNHNGKLAVTRVELRPEITFEAGHQPLEEAFEKLHQRAHRECFIANSVTTLITISATK